MFLDICTPRSSTLEGPIFQHVHPHDPYDLNNVLLRSPCDTTMQVRLLDEPMIRQRPLCHRINELHSEITQQLWDQLRHFKERDILAQAGAGAGSELS